MWHLKAILIFFSIHSRLLQQVIRLLPHILPFLLSSFHSQPWQNSFYTRPLKTQQSLPPLMTLNRLTKKLLFTGRPTRSRLYLQSSKENKQMNISLQVSLKQKHIMQTWSHLSLWPIFFNCFSFFLPSRAVKLHQ